MECFTEDDLAILSFLGDDSAISRLWEQSIPLAGRVARLFTRRYGWIVHEDLTQSILVQVPRIIARFKPDVAREKQITWSKYLYFALYRACQDELRRHDPLGVKIPRKKMYPNWCVFSELTDSSEHLDAIVDEGLKRIDES